MSLNDAVIPKSWGGVVSTRVFFVVFLNCWLEMSSFSWLLIFEFNKRKYLGSLLATHNGDLCAREHKHEARGVSSTAHTIVTSSVRCTKDCCNLRYICVSYCAYKLCTVFSNTFRLYFLSDHEASNVLQENDGYLSLWAELNKVSPLHRAFTKQDTIVRYNTDWVAVKLSKASN